jgi:hypothetical protein
MDLIAKILEAVSALSKAEGPAEVWIRPLGYRGLSAGNHCVLFLKPEALAARDGVRVEAILELVLAALRTHDVKTGAVRVLNGPYLARHRIMEAHYGVINRVSRLGEGALSRPTQRKLVAACGGAEHRILGAHQFLEEFPEVSAFALNVIADSVGTRKIASGKYFIVAEVAGEKIVVLNPFHPYQIMHFTPAGRTIVVFECWTDTAWAALRSEMTGATDPARAAPGSIRRTLLDRKRQLGLGDVRTATNGVHCSAGPLEAMAEYCRFFSDHAAKAPIKESETPFGRLLLRHGLGEKDIARLAKNPILGKEGDGNYAFNLTEDKDSEVAAGLLAKIMAPDTAERE